MKKILALILAVVFVLSLCALPALAAGDSRVVDLPLPGDDCDHIYMVTLEEEIVCYDANQHYVTITNFSICSKCGHQFRELAESYFENHSIEDGEELRRYHLDTGEDLIFYEVWCRHCTYVGEISYQGSCNHYGY